MLLLLWKLLLGLCCAMLLADTCSEFTGVGSVSISLALFWAFFLGANATAGTAAAVAVVVEVVTPLLAAGAIEVGGIETNFPSYLMSIPLPSAVLVGAAWAVTALVAICALSLGLILAVG